MSDRPGTGEAKAIRLARFEAFTEAIEACGACSADEVRVRIEELRGAARPGSEAARTDAPKASAPGVWRTGTKIANTLYHGDVFVGSCTTPEMAACLVADANGPSRNEAPNTGLQFAPSETERGRPDAQSPETMRERESRYTLGVWDTLDLLLKIGVIPRRESPQPKGEPHASRDGDGHGAALAGRASGARSGEGGVEEHQLPLEHDAGSDGGSASQVPLRGGAVGSGSGRDIPASVAPAPNASQEKPLDGGPYGKQND